MAEYLTNTTDLTKVASAIREKGGTSDPLVYPDGFVTAIQAIQTGTKPEQTKSVIITSNGTTTVIPDEGKTLSSVSITTNVPVNGIPGRKIGTYAVTDGILSFSVEQEDFAFDDRYANFYVKKSSVKWGCFAHRTASTDIKSWIATTEESAAFEYNNTCISVEQSGVFYNINWTLGDSLSDYYSGEVTVYALPSS